jgi:hypothetical protein
MDNLMEFEETESCKRFRADMSDISYRLTECVAALIHRAATETSGPAVFRKRSNSLCTFHGAKKSPFSISPFDMLLYRAAVIDKHTERTCNIQSLTEGDLKLLIPLKVTHTEKLNVVS